MTSIILASFNTHKGEEIRQMLPETIRLLTLRDIGWTMPIPEPYLTFTENARVKAMTIYEKTRVPALADDSGLEVDALAGRPGVHSARYAGIGQDDRKNVLQVVSELEGVSDRRARFRAVLAFCPAPAEVHYFEGVVEGRISLQPEGDGGFGYDPIFIPEGFPDTFGTLPRGVKNRISHRAKALRKFVDYIRSTMTIAP